MSENDPGYAAIFAPYPAAHLSTTGAIVDTVRYAFILQH